MSGPAKRTIMRFEGGDMDGTLDSDNCSDAERIFIEMHLRSFSKPGAAIHGAPLAMTLEALKTNRRPGPMMSVDGKTHKYTCKEYIDHGDRIEIVVEYSVLDPKAD